MRVKTDRCHFIKQMTLFGVSPAKFKCLPRFLPFLQMSVASKRGKKYIRLTCCNNFQRFRRALLRFHQSTVKPAIKPPQEDICPMATPVSGVNLLIRPCEVFSCISNVAVLEVAHHALGILLQHRHVIVGHIA